MRAAGIRLDRAVDLVRRHVPPLDVISGRADRPLVVSPAQLVTSGTRSLSDRLVPAERPLEVVVTFRLLTSTSDLVAHRAVVVQLVVEDVAVLAGHGFAPRRITHGAGSRRR